MCVELLVLNGLVKLLLSIKKPVTANWQLQVSRTLEENVLKKHTSSECIVTNQFA